jgi:hypothetical protein
LSSSCRETTKNATKQSKGGNDRGKKILPQLCCKTNWRGIFELPLLLRNAQKRHKRKKKIKHGVLVRFSYLPNYLIQWLSARCTSLVASKKKSQRHAPARRSAMAPRDPMPDARSWIMAMAMAIGGTGDGRPQQPAAGRLLATIAGYRINPIRLGHAQLRQYCFYASSGTRNQIITPQMELNGVLLCPELSSLLLG